MLVATLVANLGENFVIDGGFTISYFLFAIILVVAGGGKYSLDHLSRKKKKFCFISTETIKSSFEWLHHRRSFLRTWSIAQERPAFLQEIH